MPFECTVCAASFSTPLQVRSHRTLCPPPAGDAGPEAVQPIDELCSAVRAAWANGQYGLAADLCVGRLAPEATPLTAAERSRSMQHSPAACCSLLLRLLLHSSAVCCLLPLLQHPAATAAAAAVGGSRAADGLHRG